jgi:hypothetical protein
MPYKNPERPAGCQGQHARRHCAPRVEPSRGTPRAADLSSELRLATAHDVLGVIEAQIAAVPVDEEVGTAERARVIATLCGFGLRAIEAGDLAGRLEALERHLQD